MRSRSLIQAILESVGLGTVAAGGGQPDTPAAPTDATFHVPGMS